MSRDRKDILFITAGPIGDAVLTSGLLHRLVEREADARFTIAAGPAAITLFRDTPRLEALIPVTKRRHSLHWWDLWQQVRGRRWHTIIDMRGSGLAYCLRAAQRRIYRRPAAGSPVVHKALEAAQVIGSLGDPPSPFLYTSDQTESRAADAIGQGGPILAIAPGASWLGKTWPAERFAQIAIDLTAPGAPFAGGRVLLTGSPDDRKACQTIVAALPADRVFDLFGLDLLTIYACFKRVQLFIGNDSGLMHLSAAAGAPTLGLFGPTNDRLYRPWGTSTAIVRGPTAFAEYGPEVGRNRDTMCFMLDLGIESVVDAARQLLQQVAVGQRRESTSQQDETIFNRPRSTLEP